MNVSGHMIPEKKQTMTMMGMSQRVAHQPGAFWPCIRTLLGNCHLRTCGTCAQREKHKLEDIMTYQEGDIVRYSTPDGEGEARVRRVYSDELELVNEEQGYQRVALDHVSVVI